ncbi:MAG TPA: flagellar protein FlaG [Deltaproteobacteria bacterium]|nr:flagellar protein FlaG [Deltaproteobacteria bacterium]
MSIDMGIKEVARQGAAVETQAPAVKRVREERSDFVGLLRDPSERKKDMSLDEMDKLASDIQIQLKRLNTELRIEVDRESKTVIVKILEPESGEVIREIPPSELLKIRERMHELIGVFYDNRT